VWLSVWVQALGRGERGWEERALRGLSATGFFPTAVMEYDRWMLRERKLFDIAALGLILGGALGNIRDRYDHGFVLDYADFHIGSFHPFLVINLADACITCGVLIILARALFMREKPPAPQGETQPAQGEQLADPTAENSTNA